MCDLLEKHIQMMDIITWTIFLNIFAGATSMPERFENQHGVGGELVPGVSSLQACESRCEQQPGVCFGLDFDLVTLGCYFHDVTTECQPLRFRPNVIHIRFTQCGGSQAGSTVGSSPQGGSTVPQGSGSGVVTPPPAAPGNPFAPTTRPPGRERPTPDGEDDDSGFDDTQNYPDVMIPNGVLISGVSSMQDCLTLCRAVSNCQGFDWNVVRSECRVHTMLTECTGFVIMPGTTHVRVKANCEPVTATCTNLVFQTFVSSARSDGTLILSGESFESCQTLCSVTSSCQAVTWHTVGQRCFMHTTTSFPTSNSCCRHARKLCADPTAPPVGATTTGRTTQGGSSASTAPPALTTTTAPVVDTGKCPSQLQGFVDTRSFGGEPVLGINDTTACKDWCLANASCAAVDFDMTSTEKDGRCLWHSTDDYDPTFTEVDDCCIQFRKLDECQPKRCWNMEQIAVTNDLMGGEYPPIEELLSVSSNSTDSYPEVVLEECAGLCVVEAAFSIYAKSGAFSSAGPAEVARYCDNSIRAEDVSRLGRSCQTEVLEEIDDVRNITVVCYCQTDACNAFWVQALEATIAHYPLDCNTEDRSFAGRHGVGRALEFSGTDQAKNWSASFNGSNYIEVPAFSNLLLGVIGPSPNFYITPNFTLFFWVKFTTVSDETWTLFSNGPHGRASLDVYSEWESRSMRSLTAAVKLQGQVHSLTVQVPYDEWKYCALRITSNEVTGNLDFSISTGDVAEDGEYDVVDTGIAISDTGIRLDPTGNTLTIGRQSQPASLPGSTQKKVDPEYFIGLLDEIWLLAYGLNDFELTALVEMTYYPTRLEA